MRFPLQLLHCLLVAAALPVLAAALPPMRGSVSGELHVSGDRAPPIPWTLDVEPGADDGPRLMLEAAPPDARLRVLIHPRAEGKDGAWRIEEGWAEAHAWWPRLMPSIAPGLASAQAGGRLVVSGRGPWTQDGPAGTVAVEWRSDALPLPVADTTIRIEEIHAQLEVRGSWGDRDLSGRGGIRFERATVGETKLAEGEVALVADSIGPDVVFTVGPTRLVAFGGELAVAPFRWRRGTEELILPVRVNSVELAELAAFTPGAVRDAQGRVSGDVLFRWSSDAGLVPLDGGVQVVDGEPVRLRLAPQPGFLTRRVPRRLRLLPDWAGALGEDWFSPANPAYEVLERIELGREALIVESLVLEFFPPDDPQGRTVHVRVQGRPSDESVVERVTIDVNLAGPLMELINIGLENRVRIGSVESGRPDDGGGSDSN